MHKFKFYFIAFCSVFVLFSCNKSDDTTAYVQLHYFAPQYLTDIAIIEDFLATHYVVTPTSPDDEMQFAPIVAGDGHTPISEMPELQHKDVDYSGFTYKIYYLMARQGVGESPTRADQVLAVYDGSYLAQSSGKTTNTRFEYSPFPESYTGLDQTIKGWTEIFPFFKAGTAQASESGPATYSDYGIGAMFLPSAFGYYNQAKSGNVNGVAGVIIPSYSPLVFTFKLFDVKRADQDGDGILSKDEDLNNNGIFTDDDTDGDGIPNYQDSDDDGDGFLTKAEIKYITIDPITQESIVNYYTFDNAPNCSGDTTSAERVRKYLDASCH